MKRLTKRLMVLSLVMAFIIAMATGSGVIVSGFPKEKADHYKVVIDPQLIVGKICFGKNRAELSEEAKFRLRGISFWIKSHISEKTLLIEGYPDLGTKESDLGIKRAEVVKDYIKKYLPDRDFQLQGIVGEEVYVVYPSQVLVKIWMHGALITKEGSRIIYQEMGKKGWGKKRVIEE